MNLRRCYRGFTMLELLIALLVFTLGMLGMASLLVVSIKTNHSAFLRTQASFVAQSMADRMRANPHAMWLNAYNNMSYPTGNTDPCLGGVACSYTDIATRDRAAWSQQLTDVLPGATADITCTQTVGIAAANLAANPPYNGLCAMHVNWNESSLNRGTAGTTQTFAWVFQP
jgi:type IV pilus assembly protein PilV